MAGEGQNQGGGAGSQNQGGEGGQQQQQQQSDAKAYLQYFPEAIRGEKTLEKFSGKDANEVLGKVAQSYINLEKHTGSMIRIPGEKADPAELAAFREKLGVPKDPAGYEVEEVKVGDKVLFDKGDTATFLKWAHENGFSKSQAKAMIDRLVQHEQTRSDIVSQKATENAEAAYGKIKEDWGSLTDRNVALVQRSVKEFGSPEFAEYLDETGLGNDPRFLKFVFGMAQPMMEDGLIKGENLGIRRADAQAEINRLMGSKEWLGGDKATIEKIRELSVIAHSE
jgi:hypothetical protein